MTVAGGESAPRLDSKSPSKGELGKNTTMVNEGNEQKSAPVGLSTSMSFSRFSLSFDQSEGDSKGMPKKSPATAAALEAHIMKMGGDKPVHSVLVANNGLAAVKFIRSIRSWAFKNFGDERAVNLIAMATPEDMKADAEHIRLADQFIEVPGGRNVNNYANVQLICSLAVRSRVDAVWPGWGHASEKPELPEMLSATPTGIRFIGPHAQAMAALGDKIGSSILAQSAGVPTLPWSGDDVQISYDDCPQGEIPEDIYDKACLHNVSEAVACFERINAPIMLKASWGGGGKGIRMVKNVDEVPHAFKQVQAEVPGSPIFAMKLAKQSRHLEVQLICDMYGNVCSVFSRDCSVQRRHQKIVEEGPVTVASAEMREDMERCARALARSVKYVGAATAEFLYAMDDKEYCFLELNPRLQVEHPVTEWISGVNIPACQLLIAQGVPLHAIPDLRRLYGQDPNGTDPVDFENTNARIPPNGHVLAVRITAENANDGFKPTAGKVEEVSFRSTPDVWGYFSVKGGGAVHEFSDSQFGHLFAKADTRNGAIRAMVVALKEIRVRGEIRTNTDYVCDLIQTEDFVNDMHHTGWLDHRIANQITTGTPPWHLSVVCGAVLRASQRFNQRVVEYLGYLEKGQLPPSRISMVSSTESIIVDGEKFTVDVTKTGPQSLSLTLNGSTIDVVSRKLNDGGLLIQLDGESHVVHSEEEPSGTRLTIGTSTCLLSNENDPSRLTSLSTGKLIRYLVEDGVHMNTNMPYAEIEVMKMVMTLTTPAAGHIFFELPEGSVLNPGALIARLRLDDPSSVKMSTPFVGEWPELGPPVVKWNGVERRFIEAMNKAENILAGYPNSVDETVEALWKAITDPSLGLVRWNEAFGVVSSRLPGKLMCELEQIANECAADLESIVSKEDSGAIVSAAMQDILDILSRGMEECEEDEKANLQQLCEPLQEVALEHVQGVDFFCRKIAKNLIDSYCMVEEKFDTTDGLTEQEIIDSMRKENASNLDNIVSLVLSHNALVHKTSLVDRLLTYFVSNTPDHYRHQLRRLSSLRGKKIFSLSLRAQQMLERSLLGELYNTVFRVLSGQDVGIEEYAEPEPAQIFRRSTITEGLYAGLTNLASPTMQTADMEHRISMLVEAPAAVEDALASIILSNDDPIVTQRALRTYVRRIYHPFVLLEPQMGAAENGISTAYWAYEDPDIADSHDSRECVGAAIMISESDMIEDGLQSLNQRKSSLKSGMSDGILHIILAKKDSLDNSDLLAKVNMLSEKILSSGFSAVSILSMVQSLVPKRTVAHFSIQKKRFELDPIMDIEPPYAKAQELQKLSSFNMVKCARSRNRQWNMFTVSEDTKGRLSMRRLFIRGIIRQLGRPDLLAATYSGNAATVATAAMKEVESFIGQSLTELERAAHIGDNPSKQDWAHIFINVMCPLAIGDEKDDMKVALSLRAAAAAITSNHISSLRHTAVAQWEVRFRSMRKAGAWRVVVSVPTGHESGEECVDIYKEVVVNGQSCYKKVAGGCVLEGRPVLSPYEPLAALELKQLAARRHKTTYCYDFPAVFEHALMQVWASRAAAGEPGAVPPSTLVEALELVPRMDASLEFRSTTPLVALRRPPSQNKVGVVAWLMTLYTPECTQGRQIVVIANDITHSFGAFGPKEDAMFRAATEFALDNRLPVVYLAANSGARVGLAEEIKQSICAAWINPEDPTKGFKYIYLTAEDHHSILEQGKQEGLIPFKSEKVIENGEERWKLTDIIGMEDGLGVECLSGSGAIAGVYSKAFKEGFTLTLVSGRTVGIGAYLARLGRRCIQRQDQPIILTGFAALNKLLGREVYTSHMQLGGPRIMGTNGVSHHIVQDDLEGIIRALEWISYVPARMGEMPPRLSSSDPIDRKVMYQPSEGEKLDPRQAISGKMDDSTGAWVSGLFDKGSWIEAQPNWAKTVVTGRARLGGIPCGVIAVEVNTVMLDIPADPGMPDSSEKAIPQAGQVWFPDSALKTAHAMEEFDLEGLPLFILANWRGFSGGQRDLFEGVLQAGSLIVDNLRSYRQPVFMYIPPGCELRGGAWVVIDSQINIDQVESYADTMARGGVLEPEGMVEIKFRNKDLVAMMHRVDPTMKQLMAQYGDKNHPEVKARESRLLPVYIGIATSFAQMHDTPVRMLAKGVLKGIIPWENSRKFFALRLKRRLAEEALYKHVASADASISLPTAKDMVKSWYFSSPMEAQGGDFSGLQLVSDINLTTDQEERMWRDDHAFMSWIESSNGAARISMELKNLRQKSASKLVTSLSTTPEGTEGLIKGLEDALGSNPSLALQLRNLINQRS